MQEEGRDMAAGGRERHGCRRKGETWMQEEGRNMDAGGRVINLLASPGPGGKKNRQKERRLMKGFLTATTTTDATSSSPSSRSLNLSRNLILTLTMTLTRLSNCCEQANILAKTYC